MANISAQVKEAFESGVPRKRMIIKLVSRPKVMGEIEEYEADERMAEILRVYGAIEHPTPISAAKPEPVSAEPIPDEEPPIEVYEDEQPTSQSKRRKNAKVLVSELVELMERDPELSTSVGYNQFTQSTYVIGPLPWDCSGDHREWTPTDDEHLYAHLQVSARAKDRRDVMGALRIYEHMREFDPLRDMLLGMANMWDGTPRVDRMLVDLMGCADTQYTSSAWATWMAGAFMRGVQPGIKFELMAVMHGPQGFRKTEFCKRLAIREDWYADGPRDLADTANAAREMRGKFICELGELGGLKEDKVELVKAALSRTDDYYAEKYQERATSHPRHCALIATTNRNDFLRDPTGSRRFLPFKCGVNEPAVSIFTHVGEEYITQCWAELSWRYRSGGNKPFRTYLDQSTAALADEVRAEYCRTNDVEDAVSSWMADTTEKRVCGAMVAQQALGIDRVAYSKDKRLQHQVCEALSYSCKGWAKSGKKQRCGIYGTVTVWVRT